MEKEMLILLPEEWDIGPDFGFTYTTDSHSPFDVFVKPINATEEQSDLLYSLKKRYSLVHAKYCQIQKPNFEFVQNLGTENIYPEKQYKLDTVNIYQNKSQNFSETVKKRWYYFHKSK